MNTFLSVILAMAIIWRTEYLSARYCYISTYSDVYTIYEIDPFGYSAPLFAGPLVSGSKLCVSAQQGYRYYAETYVREDNTSFIVRSHIKKFHQVFLPDMR
jgi:hypothetical protein